MDFTSRHWVRFFWEKKTPRNSMGLSWFINGFIWVILGFSWFFMGFSWMLHGFSWFIMDYSWFIMDLSQTLMVYLGFSIMIVGKSGLWEIKPWEQRKKT